MQWWNEILDWFGSDEGRAVMASAVIPFVAIVIAGLVSALIGRGSTKRIIALNDRDNRVSAVATMIGAARRASVWNTLGVTEQQHADHVASEADVRVRLLGVPGSGLAADWAAHEIAEMKKNSVSFSFQAEQSLLDFRDRMVTWQTRPGRAKKLFRTDLELWAYENSQKTNDIVTQQQAWAAAQVSAPTSAAPITPAAPATHTPSPAAAAPAPAPTPAAAPVAVLDREPAPVREDAPDDSPATTEQQATEQPTTGEAPVLVEPRKSAALSGEDTFEDDADRRLEDAIYSPPVTANAVTRRIHPPTVGDDDR